MSNYSFIEEELDGDMSADGGEDGDDADAKQEYVKKEFIARPYESPYGTLEEVESSIVKDTRPLLQMRVSRQRRDFGQDGFNFIDKDGSEFWSDLKAQKMSAPAGKKKVLDIGL